ncbi:hypothetical protein [uncultured Duncaniella sp.]|uniref:hypothetical protein n=1 Tax=uncultured Duncaniella sp. TaxID=2768039 RepID=UPI0025DF276A|nr:hypothetical protein [uncultured Duncaniella sp.]
MKKSLLQTASAPNATRLRVSKKFYSYIRERVNDCCRLLTDGEYIKKMALASIDSYLLMDDPDTEDRPLECTMIFTLLRPEIDKAISRSTSAHRRTSAKREEQAAPNPATDTKVQEIENQFIEPEAFVSTETMPVAVTETQPIPKGQKNNSRHPKQYVPFIRQKFPKRRLD